MNKIDSAVENTPARRLMLEVYSYIIWGKWGISREMVNLRIFFLFLLNKCGYTAEMGTLPCQVEAPGGIKRSRVTL